MLSVHVAQKHFNNFFPMSALDFLKILYKNISAGISFADEGFIKVENLGSEEWVPITRIRIGNYSSTNGFQGFLSNKSFFLKRRNDLQYSWRIDLGDLIETESKWPTPLKIKWTNVEVTFGHHFDKEILRKLKWSHKTEPVD